MIKNASLPSALKAAFESKSASGAIATFDSIFDDFPFKKCLVEINPVQSGSGDPSPSNVRPISGWTGCNVTRTGKNLIDPSNPTQINSTATNIRWGYRFTKPGRYAVKANSSSSATYNTGISTRKITADGTYGQATVIVKGDDFSPGEAIAFNVQEGDAIVVFAVTNTTKANAIGAFTTAKVQVEYSTEPLSPSNYESYSGDIYAFDWQSEADTIYGGTLGVTTGVLTVDKVLIDMGSLSYSYDPTNAFFTTTPSGIKSPLDSIDEEACSTYKINSGISDAAMATADTGIYLDLSNGKHKIKDTRYTDGSALATALTGQTLVYPLATPQTYHLTPQQITTLLGQNNIWADTGDTTVQYEDYLNALKAYVDAKVAALNT